MPPHPITPPKVVVFDLGKVLLDFDYGRAARRLSRSSAIDPAEFRRTIDQSPLLHQFESGGMTLQEFFTEVRRLTGYQGDLEEFGTVFGDIFEAIEPMVALHRKLRAAGVRAHVLSNTNELAIANVRRKFPFFADFDGYVFSHEAGAMKPHPAIYEALERQAGARGADVLFIDDREENAVAGLSRGWRVIHHHDPDTTRRELGRLFGWPD